MKWAYFSHFMGLILGFPVFYNQFDYSFDELISNLQRLDIAIIENVVFLTECFACHIVFDIQSMILWCY